MYSIVMEIPNDGVIYMLMLFMLLKVKRKKMQIKTHKTVPD